MALLRTEWPNGPNPGPCRDEDLLSLQRGSISFVRLARSEVGEANASVATNLSTSGVLVFGTDGSCLDLDGSSWSGMVMVPHGAPPRFLGRAVKVKGETRICPSPLL